MTAKPRILIVDDDPNLRHTVSRALKTKGYAPVGVASGRAALTKVEKERPIVALIDLKLPDMDGLELVSQIKQRSPETECVILTGYASQASVIEAINRGAYSYLEKPHDTDQVLTAIRGAVEKRKAGEALRRSEEAYRLLFEQSVDGIIIIAKGLIVRANHAFCAFHGLPVEKVVGMHPLDLLHPDDRDAGFRRIEAIQSGKPAAESHVYRALRADGSIFWVEVRSAQLEWEGEPALQSIVRDITERVRSEEERAQAEETLRESEQRYRALFERSNDGVFILDLDGVYIAVNQRAASMLGYEPDELVGESAERIVISEEYRNAFQKLKAVSAGQSLPIYERTFLAKDGTRVPAEVNIVPVCDAAGNPLHIQSIVRDITERVRSEEKRARAEEALRDSEERYRNVYHTAPLAFVVWDRDCLITDWNEHAEKLFGWSREDVLGSNFFEFLVPEGARPQVEEVVSALLRDELPNHSINENLTKDGEIILCEWNNSILYDGKGRVIGAMSLALDITERVRSEEKRAQAEETLKRRMDHLAALSQASRAVTASLELDEVLAEIVSLASEVAAADYTSVVLVDEAGHLGKSADNVPGAPTIEYRLRDNGLTMWIVHSRWPVVVDEIGENGVISPVPGAGAPRLANPLLVDAGVKSLAGLPLVVKDRLLGVLYLHSLRSNTFRGQLPLLIAFANQVAVAIENARLYEQAEQEIAERQRTQEALQRYAERLRALHEIDGAILAAQSPEETAHAALQHIRRLIPCTRASVTVFDEGSSAATVLAARSNSETQVDAGTRIPPMPPEDMEVLRQGQHFLVEDIAALLSPRTVEKKLHEEGVRSFMTSPLIAHGELVGTLNLGAADHAAFEPEHLEIVREVGDDLAVALYQARLLEQIQRHAEELERQVAERTRDLERRSTQLQVAAEVARDATTARDLGDLLGRAVNLVQERFGFYHAGIFLVDERNEYAVLQAAAGAASRKVLEQRHQLKVGEEGIVGHVAGGGRPYIALNVNTDPKYLGGSLLTETRSEIALPLKVNGDVIGVLDAQSAQEGAFDEESAAVLQILADQLAVAIEKTRLFERTQAALEERLRAVVSNAPVVLVAVDREGVFTLSEGKGLDALGITPGEHIGKSAFDVYRNQPDVCEYIRRALAGEENAPVVDVGGLLFETWYAPLYGESGEVTGVIGVATDITERRRLEEQIRQQERLAAIGQLAGGIAHDFNNFLTSIMLYAQLLLGKPNLPPDLASNINIILDETRGAAQLVQQILDFSRRAMIDTGPVDLEPFIDKTVGILRRTLPENIHITVETRPEKQVTPFTVKADPTRIQQVVMNLALNARDAMPKGGELRISLSRVEVKPEVEPPVIDMPAGDWICLAISDTGTGIAPNILLHIFEPFFTTKGPGKGTGLGLAQVHGIVGQHGGHVGMETEVGEGTTFRVYLPAHETQDIAQGLEKGIVPPEGRGETILLAEDEEKVREAGREILEMLGYRVLTAANGREALGVYRTTEKVDLVITDLVMPEIGGKELAQELKKEYPHARVLAITGYALGEDMDELLKAGILDLIQKPFDIGTLGEIVRQVLDTQ